MGLPPGDRVGLFTLNVVGNGINGGVALAAPECGGVEVDGYDRPAAGEGERITADPRAEVDHGFARRCSGLVEPGGFVSSDGLGGCLFEADAVEPHLVGAVELGATFAAEFGRQQGEPDEVGRVELAEPRLQGELGLGRGAHVVEQGVVVGQLLEESGFGGIDGRGGVGGCHVGDCQSPDEHTQPRGWLRGRSKAKVKRQKWVCRVSATCSGWWPVLKPGESGLEGVRW